MQSKIYYKGKSVRRIIEVAEVTGLEGDNVNINNVYEWNPKEDSLKPTGIPSVLKQGIARLKGMSSPDIENEIQRRKKVIDWMVDKDITKTEGVAEVINKYYRDPEGLLNEIEKTGAGR